MEIATRRDAQASLLPVTRGALITGYASDPIFQGKSLQDLLIRTIREEDGLYYQGERLAVPESLVDYVIKQCHEPPHVGHMGITKTLALVRSKFWWPSWRNDVTQYIKECTSCQVHKPLTGKPHGPLLPLEIPKEPWESVSIDFVVELPTTASGYDTLVVFVDRLTKMVHLVPTTRDYTALSCADAFMHNVFRLHGLPKAFVTDRDKVWTSEFHAQLCQLLTVERCLSTAYHPQSDGQVERMNRIVQEVLRHYVSPRADNWDRLLPLVEFAINSAKQESTGFSPFQLNYGRNPSSPLDREFDEVLPRANFYKVFPKCPTARSITISEDLCSVELDHSLKRPKIGRRPMQTRKEHKYLKVFLWERRCYSQQRTFAY